MRKNKKGFTTGFLQVWAGKVMGGRGDSTNGKEKEFLNQISETFMDIYSTGESVIRIINIHTKYL